jgi:hypothetical protein
LLDIEVVVDDGRQLGPQRREMLDGLLDAVVSDVVGCGLGAQVEMIAHVLFDRALAEVAADDRVGQLDVFDDGLQLTPILLGHLTSKDGRDLVGLADGAVGIQQTLAESIQSGATMEDEVIAVLHLSEEQAMLAPGLSALLVGEERREGSQPLVGACQQVSAGQGIGQLLQSLGILTVQEGIGTLLKFDSFLPQVVGQPVMLIETNRAEKGR